MAVRHKVNRSLLLGALLLLGECPVSYSAGVTLFGIGNELDSIIVAASFSILICVILVLEHSISYLHDYLEDTHYIDMMIAIENELMIVGSVAFILTIIINSESEALPKEWLLGIEFVDILVPLTVFVYCIHGILLIFLSIQQCATWSKATYQERPDLFASFYETIQNWYGRWRYLPYNPNMHALEFRIFRNIFCEMFNIKLEALAFDAYAAKQWQNFLVHLVEIKFSSWICVVAAFWLRTLVEKTGGDVDACEGLYRGDHRLLGASASSQSTAEYDECIAIDSALSFLYVGIAVLAITFALALHSRWLELRFLRLRGIEHVDEYDVYIESQESSSRSRRGSRGVVSESGLAAYDETELKNAVVNLRRVRAEERARTRRAEKHNIRLGDEEESASFLGRACSAIKMIIWRTQKDASSISHRIISSSFAKEPVGPRAGMLRKNSSIGYVLNSDASDSTPNMDAITEEDESLALPDHVGILARQATVKNINNRYGSFCELVQFLILFIFFFLRPS
jgi:hypothetical protein